jgi:TonB family protein
MKFNGLKFLKGSITAFSMLVFLVACNDESGNNSTTANEADSASSPPVSATDPVKKKIGKASAKMTTDADASAKIEKDKDGYYIRTEVLPSYNGGQTALETYITNTIEYPQEAIDNSVEGTVNVQFLVDEQGNVSEVKTIGNKIGSGLEEEAIRVVSSMPKWTPGQVKGKDVKTWRTLPITYRLEAS